MGFLLFLKHYIEILSIPNSFLRRLYLLTILMVDGAFTTAPPVSHLWEHIYCSFINWVVRVLHADWLKDAAYQTIHQWYDQKKNMYFFFFLLFITLVTSSPEQYKAPRWVYGVNYMTNIFHRLRTLYPKHSALFIRNSLWYIGHNTTPASGIIHEIYHWK